MIIEERKKSRRQIAELFGREERKHDKLLNTTELAGLSIEWNMGLTR
jgi:hypothetical protein